MAASLVGTGTFITSTINGTSLALTLSTGAAAAGDLVIAFWSYSRAGLTAQITSSSSDAYTQIDTRIANGNLQTEAWYRFLTSSETVCQSCGTGNTQDSTVLSAIVLRGCSSNITANSTIGTSSNPNSPSVTVGAPNSAVITAAAMISTASLTAAPSGFTNMVSTSQDDLRDCSGGLAYKSTDTGLTDPSSWTATASAAWAAWTITVASTEAPPFTWLMMGHFPDQVYASVPMIGY